MNVTNVRVLVGLVLLLGTASLTRAADRATAGAVATPVTMYGAGPKGTDNAMVKPCTGTRNVGGQVLCVRSSASGNGTATSPFGTIGGAVAKAHDGDVIQVAGGRYAESVRVGNYGPSDCNNAGIADHNFVFLGGFRNDFGARNAAQYPAMVTGKDGIPAFVLCVMGGKTVVDGFAISTGQKSRGFVGSAGGYAGEGGSLTISHNVVSGNKPSEVIDDSTYGGGIVVTVLSRASVDVTDNQVRNNQAGRGAGITTQTTSETKPVGSMKVMRNLVEDNTSLGSHGGGMNVVGNAEIAYNVIRRNRVLGQLGGGGWGGGFIADGGRPIVVHHNVVVENQAAAYGNGEFYDSDVDARVSFEFVSSNGCSPDPLNSEILVDVGDLADSKADFTNITVTKHRCPTMTAGALVVQQGAKAKVHNSIFADNVGLGTKPFDFGIDATGSIEVDTTVTKQGWPGRGNTKDDPKFADMKAGDYRSTKFPTRGAFVPGGLRASP